MLKKDITYENFDGEQVTETFHFHLSKAEIAELEVSHEGGLSDYLVKLANARDGGEILANMKALVGAAVGRRSPDGKRFIKDDEARAAFFETDAWSEFFMSTLINAKEAAAFMRAIVPSDLAAKLDEKQMAALEAPSAADDHAAVVANVATNEMHAGKKTVNEYSRAELVAMTDDEFHGLVGYDSRVWSHAILEIAFERRTSSHGG